jgi:hypothetical protein
MLQSYVRINRRFYLQGESTGCTDIMISGRKCTGLKGGGKVGRKEGRWILEGTYHPHVSRGAT